MNGPGAIRRPPSVSAEAAAHELGELARVVHDGGITCPRPNTRRAESA